MSNDSLLCVLVDQHTVRCGEEEYGKAEAESLYKPDSGSFWIYLILYMVLVLFAGRCGGRGGRGGRVVSDCNALRQSESNSAPPPSWAAKSPRIPPGQY